MCQECDASIGVDSDDGAESRITPRMIAEKPSLDDVVRGLVENSTLTAQVMISQGQAIQGLAGNLKLQAERIRRLESRIVPSEGEDAEA